MELRPENASVKPIPINADSDLQIVGKVVAIRNIRDEQDRRPRKQ
jgi:SOS-response transcriptional repressor LexA